MNIFIYRWRFVSNRW